MRKGCRRLLLMTARLSGWRGNNRTLDHTTKKPRSTKDFVNRLRSGVPRMASGRCGVGPGPGKWGDARSFARATAGRFSLRGAGAVGHTVTGRRQSGSSRAAPDSGRRRRRRHPGHAETVPGARRKVVRPGTRAGFQPAVTGTLMGCFTGMISMIFSGSPISATCPPRSR